MRIIIYLKTPFKYVEIIPPISLNNFSYLFIIRWRIKLYFLPPWSFLSVSSILEWRYHLMFWHSSAPSHKWVHWRAWITRQLVSFHSWSRQSILGCYVSILTPNVLYPMWPNFANQNYVRYVDVMRRIFLKTGA
jgi:hypothetical protein